MCIDPKTQAGWGLNHLKEFPSNKLVHPGSSRVEQLTAFAQSADRGISHLTGYSLGHSTYIYKKQGVQCQQWSIAR